MEAFSPVHPLISVVMPTYNGEKYIASALESIRSEEARDVEVVVVNDGSTDRTAEIAQEFSTKMPLRLIAPGRIGNWVKATNLGLNEARGEWACFLHDDDLWLPGRIRRLQAEIAKAKGALVVHDARFVGPDGRILGAWTCPLQEGNVEAAQFLEHLLVQNFVAICAGTFVRKAVLESGGMDETLWHTADWELWLRMGSLGPVRVVREALSAVRIHHASQTMTHRLGPGEWEQQLTTVFQRHFSRWSGAGKPRAMVEEAAMASVAINAALAAGWRGEPVRWQDPVWKLVALGPWGLRRYLRDSRIVERLVPRLKLRRASKA